MYASVTLSGRREIAFVKTLSGTLSIVFARSIEQVCMKNFRDLKL
jgi:hypothetical protein